MNQTLSIIMYHYIRDLSKSKFPKIKGLDINLFVKQLEYLTKHYQFISVNDLLSKEELPLNPVLLTFDDGYIDHYTYVFPKLRERGISGAFFPTVNASKNHCVLDVNKIHFVLASVNDITMIVDEINQYALENKESLKLDDLHTYKSNIPKSRFDTDDVVYVKYMLQQGLPLAARNYLSDKLFKKYISVDEADFASTLYVNTEHLKEMRESGMSIGIHGYSHSWLATLDEIGQSFEINESVKFLHNVGVKDCELTIAYPYGSYNDVTLKIVANHNVRIGFTSQVGKADLSKPLELRRFDTNDFTAKFKRDISGVNPK